MKKLLFAGACAAMILVFAGPPALANPPALDDLISEALERNPAIRGAFARYRAALQKAPQATGLPDPQLGVTQYARSPETRVGPQSTMLSISQRFPWLGKLRTQGEVAEKEAAAAAAMFEAQKDETVRRVKVSYWDLGYVDRAAEIAEEDLGVLRLYETLAQARYSQGVGLQQAALKLQAEITQDQNRLHALRRRRVDVESELNALRDRDPATPIGKVELPAPPGLDLDPDRLQTVARNNQPELAAALLRIESDEKRIDAARKQDYPDFTLGAGYALVKERRDLPGVLSPPPSNGKDVYSVTVGVSLPIYRRKYRAAVFEATEKFLASKEGYRDLWNRVRADLRALAFDLETMRDQIRLFETTLLPQARQALISGETAYASGEIQALDLIDSRRVLFDVELGLTQLRVDYLKSLAELERAVGAPLAEAR